MKHAVISAHPNVHSFTTSVAESYAQAAEALGHAVLRRNLYLLNFEPRMQPSELPWAETFRPAADVTAERALLQDVQVFVLIYPLWLNTPPAIMKGYLERVFGYGFAYGDQGHGSEPLLSGRKLITFSSSGAPLYWVKQTGAMNAIKTLFDGHFAAVCGMEVVDHVHFGGIVPGIRDDAVATMLDQVKETVQRHFGPTQQS